MVMQTEECDDAESRSPHNSEGNARTEAAQVLADLSRGGSSACRGADRPAQTDEHEPEHEPQPHRIDEDGESELPEVHRVCEGRHSPELPDIIQSYLIEWSKTPAAEGIVIPMPDHVNMVCRLTGGVDSDEFYHIHAVNCPTVTGKPNPAAWPSEKPGVLPRKKKLGDGCALCTRVFRNIAAKRKKVEEVLAQTQDADDTALMDLSVDVTELGHSVLAVLDAETLKQTYPS